MALALVALSLKQALGEDGDADFRPASGGALSSLPSALLFPLPKTRLAPALLSPPIPSPRPASGPASMLAMLVMLAILSQRVDRMRPPPNERCNVGVEIDDDNDDGNDDDDDDDDDNDGSGGPEPAPPAPPKSLSSAASASALTPSTRRFKALATAS